MDDPTIVPSAPMKLQRASERNRLEKQFLIAAYECLAPIIEPNDRMADEDKRSVKSDHRAARKKASPLEATAGCGM
jgi:hypothetical protein